MDFGSRPFRALYQPFRDSDELVEITWFPAAPGALPLGKVSNITIPYWEQDQFEYLDGLIPLSNAEPTGRPLVRPGTGRGHVCGTDEDFREGGHYDPDAEPVTYGQQGLPTCCGAPVVLGGGARDGGSVEVVVPPLTCATAYNLPAATDWNGEVTGTEENWFRVPVPVGDTFIRVWFTGPGGISAALLVDFSSGTVCPGNPHSINHNLNGGPFSVPVADLFTPFFWMKVHRTTGTTYTIRWEPIP